MPIEPFDRLARQLHKATPLFHSQSELQVIRAGVRYPHEHTPEDHTDTRIEQMQKTYTNSMLKYQ